MGVRVRVAVLYPSPHSASHVHPQSANSASVIWRKLLYGNGMWSPCLCVLASSMFSGNRKRFPMYSTLSFTMMGSSCNCNGDELIGGEQEQCLGGFGRFRLGHRMTLRWGSDGGKLNNFYDPLNPPADQNTQGEKKCNRKTR